jgi:hypothetical protein
MIYKPKSPMSFQANPWWWFGRKRPVFDIELWSQEIFQVMKQELCGD